MPFIFETEDFLVDAPDRPHHSRENGGHVKIMPKKRFEHRYEMPVDLANSLMNLTMIVGEATTNVLRQAGLEVVRINYQDNGNWAYKAELSKQPHLHIHLYVRTSHEVHPDGNSKFQAFPDALVFPPPDTDYYDHFVPLTDKECNNIKNEVIRLSKTEKYRSSMIKLLASTPTA